MAGHVSGAAYDALHALLCAANDGDAEARSALSSVAASLPSELIAREFAGRLGTDLLLSVDVAARLEKSPDRVRQLARGERTTLPPLPHALVTLDGRGAYVYPAEAFRRWKLTHWDTYERRWFGKPAD